MMGGWDKKETIKNDASYLEPIVNQLKKVKITTLRNTVELTEASNIVNIGIETYNRDGDILWVFINTTYLEITEDYNINPDGLYIQKADGGTWESGTVFNFLVMKHMNSDTNVLVTDGSQLGDDSVPNRKLDPDAKVGSLAALITKVKTDIVSAINEIWNKNVFARFTHGTFENAVANSSIANNSNPRPQVLGVTSVSQLSEYSNRDSVAHYFSNRSTTPITVNSGTITYGDLFVKVTGSIIPDIEKLEKGMIIDTIPTTTRWTSVIDYVDIENQTIYIQDGWYEVKTGGSTTPSLPPTNSGFYINWITKIWVKNSNLFLYESDKTPSAVIDEMGFWNNKGGAVAGGVDGVNFGQHNVDFLLRSRRADSSILSVFVNMIHAMIGTSRVVLAEDVNEVIRMKRSKVGFFFEGNAAPDSAYEIVTDVNGGNAHEISGIGRIKSQSYQNKVWSSTAVTVDFKQAYLHLLTAAASSTYNVISPTLMTGRTVKVFPFQNVTLSISGTGNFVKAGGDSTTLSLNSKVSVELYSDGANWYVL